MGSSIPRACPTRPGACGRGVRPWAEGVERKIADRQAGKALCLIPCGGVDGQGTNEPCVQCRYEAAIVC